MNKKTTVIVLVLSSVAIALVAILTCVIISLSKSNSDVNSKGSKSKSKTEKDDDDFDTNNRKKGDADDDDYDDYDDYDGTVETEPEEEFDGEVITLVPTILRDNNGIDAFYTFVPQGWSATVSTEYTIDANYPLQSDVVLKSPDGRYVIEMITPMNYRDELSQTSIDQSASRSEDGGVHDIMNYSTLLHYRPASEYIDYLTGGAGISWNQYDEYLGDSQAITSFTQNVKKQAEDTIRFNQNAADNMGGQQFNYRYSLIDYNAEIVSRKGMIYRNGSSCIMEMTVYEGMYDYRIDYDIPNNLAVIYGYKETTYWGTRGVYVYMAETEEEFDKYYDMAQFVMNNSGTTGMYEACKQEILDYIIPKIIEGNMEMMDYINDTVQSVVNSYTDTNDRVTQMWDDYILDQDRYTLDDGTQVVVPITADYVYYDGENVIWTDSPGYNPGGGYEQIN